MSERPSDPPAAPEPDLAPPPILDSRAGFAAAVQWGFAAACARRARRIVIVDPGFADWPLDDPALLQTLVGWLRMPQRQLLLLAAGYDEIPRRLPRFTRWRRDWSHALRTLAVSADQVPSLPTLLLDDGPISVHLVDTVHWRGRAAADAATAAAWRERIDPLLERAEPAFPVDALGL
jgi:hypothetical protein